MSLTLLRIVSISASRRCTRVHGPHDCNDTSQARARNRPHYSRNALGNKSNPLAILLTRRGNGDKPAKRLDMPDTTGISQSSLLKSRTMPVLSRRTVAALAVSLGLLGVLSFAVQSHAATD